MYKTRTAGSARRRVGWLAAAAAFGWTAMADEVRVVATINPVHSLVSGVMVGVGAPHLIVRGASSPHDFSMRPSDAEKLEQADVVFLIGKYLEASLAGPIGTLAVDAEIVELAETDGLVRRPLREGGNFEADRDHVHGGDAQDEGGHDDGHDHEDDHDADSDGGDADRGGNEDEHGNFDLHVWLDPVNAQVMVGEIAEALARADPGNAETYSSNAAALKHRLEELQTEIAAQVSPVRGAPFIVFHDGYRYFEDRFGVVAVGSAVVSADRSPGVRRIRELQNKVRDLEVKCVMTEPQFEPRLVDVIVEGTDAKAGAVDPLGATIDSGPDLYFTLLRNMAASFEDCLATGG